MNVTTLKGNSEMEWTKEIVNANHTLIAGCSGSGKSVALNNIMYEALTDVSNLYVLIDLKKVELYAYKKLPQCAFYIDEPEEVQPALDGVMTLIDSRYSEMQAAGLKKTKEAHLYVVIDEYADLVISCGKKVIDTIQRISQIGRAAGVHLIVCTQRPTKEVIRGGIAVNLDTRLALRCTCAQDSRNIIGRSGAELLPRYGHGILQVNGYYYNIEIPLISDDDIIAKVNRTAEIFRKYTQ